MPTYSYTNLKDQIADPIRFDNLGSVLTTRNIINRSVRSVVHDVDLHSLKRKAQLTPKIFDEIYDYPTPTDYSALIDVQPQANRTQRQRWFFVNEEYFDAKKSGYENLITVADDDLVRKFRMNIQPTDTKLTVATFDSTTADGGTWAAYSDATNVATNTDNYIKGGGSLSYDLVGSATTAGVFNSALTTFDLTDYINSGSAFVWCYLTTATLITNFILEIGNDTSNYYTMTATTIQDGSAFVNGWNLLRFDFSGATQTGTVDPDASDHVRLYMTKTSGKSDNGYLFDDLTLHTGQYFDAVYYSKYGWQSSAGTYLENSAADTDLVNADTDEFDGFVHKGKYEVYKELKEFDLMKIAAQDYQEWKQRYQMRYPTERAAIINFY